MRMFQLDVRWCSLDVNVVDGYVADMKVLLVDVRYMRRYHAEKPYCPGSVGCRCQMNSSRSLIQ